MLDNISEFNPISVNDVKKYIKTILYSTKDQILTILENGSVTITDKSCNNISVDSFEYLKGLEQLKKEILNTDQIYKSIPKNNKKKGNVSFHNIENISEIY